MKRVIIVGSPRSNGRSAHLAEMLFEANIDERPEDELYLVPVSEVEIGPCIGCDACRAKSAIVLKDDEGSEVSVLRHRCVFDDDMQTLYDLIDEADELTVVSPVFFSGAPAPMKCVLDRLQPYFWVTQERGRELAGKRDDDEAPKDEKAAVVDAGYERRMATKRPATLHVIGEGGDPFGFLPLVSEVKSALACAGFKLEHVFDWVGKIDLAGEITAEAAEVELQGASVMGAPSEHAIEEPQPFEGDEEGGASRPRPRLDLGAKPYGAQSGKGGSSQPNKSRSRGNAQQTRQSKAGDRPGARSGKGGAGSQPAKGKGKSRGGRRG